MIYVLFILGIALLFIRAFDAHSISLRMPRDSDYHEILRVKRNTSLFFALLLILAVAIIYYLDIHFVPGGILK